MIVKDLFEERPDERELVISGKSVVLNTEHMLKLHSDGMLLHSFVCSPASLGELCAGWLVSEGYTVQSVEVAKDGMTATAQGASLLSAQPEKLRLDNRVCVDPGEMRTLFHRASEKYARSHGIHECVIKGDGWHILRTDIGRHNAIDKAVGAAVLRGHDVTGAVLFTSGRINVQTVQKAVRCGIGCLMSKAVITAEALSLARQLGLQVLFSVKENSHIAL